MKIRENAEAQLTYSQLEELAKRLLDKRCELTDTLSVLNRQIVKKEGCSIADAAEAASLQEEISRTSGIAEQHNETVAEIDHALRRLENGHYGVSEITGEPIGYERLLLIPWARTGTND